MTRTPTISSTNDFSEELRLASRDTGAFNWLAGLYYGRESTHATVEYHFFDSYDLGYFALPNGTPLYGFDEFNNFDQIKDSKAVFLNATFALVSAVTLHAGARYTKDKVTINNFYALEGGPLAPGPTGYSPDGGVMAYWTQTIGSQPATFSNYQTGTAPQDPLLNLSQDNNNFSYRVGVDWKPSDDMLAYLSSAKVTGARRLTGRRSTFPRRRTLPSPRSSLPTRSGSRRICGIGAAPSTSRCFTTTTGTSNFSIPLRCRAARAAASTPSTRRSRAWMAPNSNCTPRRPMILRSEPRWA